ncbi:MAG: hypothetical protein CMI30_10885, partial [Opitutae bacterium]|nr:hypothetical protein [Opitutae bacterium]
MHFLFSFGNFFTRKLSRAMDWYGCFGLTGLFSRFSFLALNCLLLSGSLQADENNSSSGETPGNALFFDGNTYVNVPDNGTLDLVSNYTIEAWINVIDTQNNTIIDKGDYRFLFQTHTSGNQGISLYRVGVGWIHSQGVIPINEWVHVAVSVANDGTVKFYKNGQLLSSHQAGLGGVDNSEINIGRQSPDTCACNLANGSFDELRIWDSVRSQEEIAAEYEAILASNTPGLLAYWKFNEENGVNVADSSLNANHGTVIGTATWLVSDAPAAGDSNDPPVDLHLTNALVSENDPVQTVVGQFEAIDPDDPEETGSYSYT